MCIRTFSGHNTEYRRYFTRVAASSTLSTHEVYTTPCEARVRNLTRGGIKQIRSTANKVTVAFNPSFEIFILRELEENAECISIRRGAGKARKRGRVCAGGAEGGFGLPISWIAVKRKRG